MEAMAMAKPVIAFANGGIGEMVLDGVTGTLVLGAPPDVEGLAAAFVRYLRDPDRGRSRGIAGRRRVEAEFEARGHAAALQAVMLAAARSG
jgi:glycosyltransferase involved in cell wall biosynthesis